MAAINITETPGFRLINGSDLNTIISAVNALAAGTSTGTYKGSFTLSNGLALRTDTTDAHTGVIQAYDVDGTAYKTFATLTNGNTPSFAIAAPSGGTVTIDGAVIGGTTPLAGTFTTISATDDVTIGNGKAVKTDTTTAHTVIFQAYDVDGTAYKTFATLTNGNTPSLAIAAPSGGTVAIDGAVIGGVTPAAITGTTLSTSGSHTFTTASAGIILKQGANGKCGTFVCNGVTPVTVNNTSIAITDTIVISLNTVGGTVGAVPAVKTITGSTGFTVAGTASDTSTYNYAIISNAA